jgi:hypothetical protein
MDILMPESQLYLQKILGQVLFYPPNVAGWPGGKNWIDSSSLMFRLRIPQLLANKEAITIRAKSDDDQEMGMAKKEERQAKAGKGNGGRVIETTIDWKQAFRQMEKTARENLLSSMASVLWQTDAQKMNRQLVEKFTDAGSRERYIQTSIIQLMSTPEYQMC